MSSAASKKKPSGDDNKISEKSKKKEDEVKKGSEKKVAAEKGEEKPKKKNEFENEPPFGVDYAKTGRSHCKSCNEAIPKGKLRISTRAPSYRYHGMMENWYHEPCFPWEKAVTDGITEAKVRGLDTIEKDDRENIRKKIKETPKAQKSEDSSSSSGASKRKSETGKEEVSTKKVKKSDEKKKH